MGRIKKRELVLTLDGAGVERASRELVSWLSGLGVTDRDLLRIRLTMEELLLRLRDRYEGRLRGELVLGKRFGKPVIRFIYKGEPFDPTAAQEDELGELTDRILANMGMSPSWSYLSGKNVLSQTVRVPKRDSQLVLIAALVLAVALGLTGSVLPGAFRENISFYLLEPMSELFSSLLNAFVGPLIFLSIISGICGLGSAAQFGRIGRQMLSRYIGFSFIGSAAAVLTWPMFDVVKSDGVSGWSQLGSIRDLLLGILPSNPVRPFLEGNSLQIIFLALFVGVTLVGLGERGARLRELIPELSELLRQAVGTVCRLLPLFVFSSFTLQIWENGIGRLAALWKPLVLCAALCSVFIVFKLTVVCLRLKVSAPVLFRKIYPSMLVGFATASGSTAFSLCTEVNEKKLGIAPELSRIGYPIGSAFYNTCLSTLFVLTAYASAEAYGCGGGIVWYITLWLVSTVVSFAVPPVSGGSLVCIGVLLMQLRLPGEALAAAGVLGLVLDFVCTGFGLGMRHMELVLQAERLGMLDREILQSDKNI